MHDTYLAWYIAREKEIYIYIHIYILSKQMQQMHILTMHILTDALSSSDPRSAASAMRAELKLGISTQ